jgi:hypothetical protein
MYTLFCQKKCGTNAPFPLTQQLFDFLRNPKARGLFVSPGFISRKDKSISDFLKALLIEKNTKLVDYFGIGNQNTYEPDPKTNELDPPNALEKHKDVITSLKIQWLNIDRNSVSDHRKMVFIFDILCDEGDLLIDINKTNYTDFLQQIDIIGVAIGSSNFSYTTYSVPWSTKSYKAQNGEADIFMFKDDENDQFIQHYVEMINRDLKNNPEQQYQKVLSKSEIRTPDDFLKSMFQESLEIILR